MAKNPVLMLRVVDGGKLPAPTTSAQLERLALGLSGLAKAAHELARSLERSSSDVAGEWMAQFAAHPLLQMVRGAAGELDHALQSKPPQNHDGAGRSEKSGGGRCDMNVFRKEGDYWLIQYDDRVCRLRDLVGFQYLVEMLREPGREFHVSELVTLVHAASPVRLGAAGLEKDLGVRRSVGGGVDFLDAQSARAYRERLRELAESLSEAEAMNDLGRMARAREEIDALSHELVSAVRRRRSGSHAERARLTITKGLTRALRQIDGAHGALAEHLHATVRRGYFCSYKPDPRSPIRWET